MKNQTVSQAALAPGAMLKSRRTRQIVGDISAVSLWRWCREGTFPQPVVVNKRNYWLASDVQGWLDERAAQSNAK